jgi:acetaldehyde dehydrogenase (acetylating)
LNLNRIRVAVVGTGNIGTDLCERLLKDRQFEVIAFVGRNTQSAGILKMRNRVEHVVTNGIDGLEPYWGQIDGLFDATSASAHPIHWGIAQSYKKWMIDLTPSRQGAPIVPVLVGRSSAMELSSEYVANYSMITCGGQSAAPLVHGISSHAQDISDVEISSSIASLSAGPATRSNIDEYIDATENMAALITGCRSVKSILVLNPADPPVMMRTTVHIRAKRFEMTKILAECELIERQVRQYVPGYDIVVSPHSASIGQVSATARVSGAGYFLPSYSGNLDIINAAAVETARCHMEKMMITNLKSV